MTDGERNGARRVPVWIWGLPLAPMTYAEVLEEATRLIERRVPSYLITANLNYAMLTHEHEELREVNREAAFILADGMPLVWASRRSPTRLPERVTGSTLIFDISRLAAARGYRVFFLGGPPGVADEAARNLSAMYSGLNVVGTVSPPYRDMTESEHAELVATIQGARPDILFVAFSQPKGETWLHRHRMELGVPLCLQVGASLDFAARRVPRAPRWIQNVGMEWAFRLGLEPKRLASRYFKNLLFLVKASTSLHTLAGDVEREPLASARGPGRS